MSYTKVFYTKLNDIKRNEILNYLSNNPSFNTITLKDNLLSKFEYLVIAYDHARFIKITAYHMCPNEYYDDDMLIELNQDILDNLEHIPDSLKDFIINLSKILFQNGTNRLQKQETFESGEEDTGRRPIYGEPDRIEYAAGRTCNKASVIYQREGLRKPEVKLSVRHGEVHKASW